MTQQRDDAYSPEARTAEDRYHAERNFGWFTAEPEPAVPQQPAAPQQPVVPQQPAAPAEPGYTLPEVPDVGWDPLPSSRRTWISRLVLLGILVAQALLTLRLSNSAFEDEALYLYAGHLQLHHLNGGAPLPDSFASYFSGSPLLYPPLAAAADAHFGLAGARALSLAFMLGATTLLYMMTRRLFNERVALVAAGCFAVTQSTLFMGALATYDAMALFLIAVAAWLAVRTARRGWWLGTLTIPPVLLLAVAVKYAALMYAPVVVALACLAAVPYHAWRSLLRLFLIPAVAVGGAYAALRLTGSDVLDGLRSTTTGRATGHGVRIDMLRDCAEWGGLLFALAVLGTVLYALKGRMSEAPTLQAVRVPRRLWRVLMGLLLTGTALLAPAYQIWIHESVSLHKHIGYGLLFATPMAALGITRIVGSHFRHPQLGILAWVTMLVLGMVQSTSLYHAWPNSDQLIATLNRQLVPDGHYLVEANSVPRYYLREQVGFNQWTSTYTITYQTKDKKLLTGEAGFQAALTDSYFDVVVFDRTVTGALDEKLTKQLRAEGKYRLLVSIPYHNSYGSGFYQVWVPVKKNAAPQQ
ncbi:ArnT family glycosyltransferase [Kitasatospora fiedleri]|uniref:ArnT family glycosyltransferase n=1 Tax=Kitasatospora fiedleri TaxID=2991545 RepID=UPI00249AB597|nr:glycosyltransferase family 39 protein [Kitasatospora fiedleri]